MQTKQKNISPITPPDSWRATRQIIEGRNERVAVYGPKYLATPIKDRIIDTFGLLLKLTGLYRFGLERALSPRIEHIDLYFPNLPKEFDGYTLLHLSDLHLDIVPDMTDAIAAIIESVATPIDLAVFTGDYRNHEVGEYRQVIPMFEKICSSIPGGPEIYFTLGNHDCADMAQAFTSARVTPLNNESIEIKRGEKTLGITGIDDVHYFYTPAADAALNDARGDFKIALVHSSEFYEQAEKAGFNLYLNGHTHGGQICLPGGVALLKPQQAPKEYLAGVWKFKNLTGYSNRGAGTTHLPIRFNCPGEIAVIRLHSTIRVVKS